MTNKYMFFNEQLFKDLDLSEYKFTDTIIPNTPVHIYEFCCVECPEDDDEAKSIKLDRLTLKLNEHYNDTFIILYSESSQFFCSILYPLVVKLETKLRVALFISQALYKNGQALNTDSFIFRGADKKSYTLEQSDFGTLYNIIFTDHDFTTNVYKRINNQPYTKADFIKIVESIDETSLWSKMVGTSYDYIPDHFLEIKDYRNDVMHNHLINYQTYRKALIVLSTAINELDRVITNKLIVNDSQYLNNQNVLYAIGKAFVELYKYAQIVGSSLSNSPVIQFVTEYAQKRIKSNDLSLDQEDDEMQAPDSEQDTTEEE